MWKAGYSKEAWLNWSPEAKGSLSLGPEGRWTGVLTVKHPTPETACCQFINATGRPPLLGENRIESDRGVR